MPVSRPFAGKVVLITGASSGIGRATALAFGRSGGKVVIGDANGEAAATASLIVGAGGEALFVKTDVSQAAVNACGRLDIAFNNVGLLQNSLIGRAAEPGAIAGTVLHLTSDAASFVTGQTYVIDGGQTSH